MIKNNRKIKINILSPGRFHVCDLARELDRNGFDVKFYSFVPTKRAMKFGLPKRCSASLYVPLISFLAISKVLFKRKSWASILLTKTQDHLTGLVMRKCDLVIAMSGCFLYSLEVAKKRGEMVILERGSKHILEQKRILESIPSLKGKNPVPDINVKRELAGYQLADYISIASAHVKRSFLLHGFSEDKLFVNPYGVNLSMFHPIPSVEKKYDLIMVGTWGYQKGCDLITKAVKELGLSLLHVGATGDLPFPNDPHFTDIGSVDETALISYYAQAKIFVFPSRQDGFGMVLSQAMACNLPIVASADCGAPDLKKLVHDPNYIEIIEDISLEGLEKAIVTMLDKYPRLKNNYAGNAISQVTWKAYGERYADFINNHILNFALGGVRLFDVIMVGNWCYRKGCDLIEVAAKEMDLLVLHVGACTDGPMNKEAKIVHVGTKDESELYKYYSLAKIFVMPSREEGLALVQAQAISCNLPIVGSPDSGAEDLKMLAGDTPYISIIKDYTVQAVKQSIASMLDIVNHEEVHYPNDMQKKMSWRAYGDRYAAFINSVIN